jgi:integrase
MPDEAAKLVAALSGPEKVSFALALYAGMRNMERLPLDWTDVDLVKARIRVLDSKSDAGIRSLPIAAPLMPVLKAEYLRQGRPSIGLVCRGPKGGAPDYDSMKKRAEKAWTKVGLTRIGFHECRHTFITTMIHAGLNAKAVSVLAGHASIDVTYDRYGHLFPGSEDEAATKLNAFYRGTGKPDWDDMGSKSRDELLRILRAL